MNSLASYYPSTAYLKEDGRLFSPFAAQNIEPISRELTALLRRGSRVLELASGTGEHAAHMTQCIPGLLWQPSDVDEDKLESIQAWRRHLDYPGNLLHPIRLSANQPPWSVPCSSFDAVVAINLMHILSHRYYDAIFNGARLAVTSGGFLAVYGPVKQRGEYFSAGNRTFEQELQSHNSDFSLPDIEELTTIANRRGFLKPLVYPMPSANHLLVFHA